MPLWSHCCAKMYRGATGHDDFTELAESNRSRKLGFTRCYSGIVMPASAGQDKMKDLFAIESSDMTRDDKSFP